MTTNPNAAKLVIISGEPNDNTAKVQTWLTELCPPSHHQPSRNAPWRATVKVGDNRHMRLQIMSPTHPDVQQCDLVFRDGYAQSCRHTIAEAITVLAAAEKAYWDAKAK